MKDQGYVVMAKDGNSPDVNQHFLAKFRTYEEACYYAYLKADKSGLGNCVEYASSEYADREFSVRAVPSWFEPELPEHIALS